MKYSLVQVAGSKHGKEVSSLQGTYTLARNTHSIFHLMPLLLPPPYIAFQRENLRERDGTDYKA
jgi:hypothetical protein